MKRSSLFALAVGVAAAAPAWHIIDSDIATVDTGARPAVCSVLVLSPLTHVAAADATPVGLGS